ncbi:GNAT family N-acetyltransferase [Candidatus Woesearchaeota archaeon]|nr:GNAT family N-acetyltransferase [Candidatus Woesearchaeota archaeon]
MRIAGKEINLRNLKKNDAISLFTSANDKDITRYTLLPYPYTLKDAKDFIEITKRNTRLKKAFELGIELKETKEIIGMNSLTNVDWKNKNAEIGYWLGKEYWGRGIMKEAIKLLLYFGFKKLKLERISATVLQPNLASAKLLEKSGFIYEGKLRRAILRRGKWYDQLCFGILKTELRK